MPRYYFPNGTPMPLKLVFAGTLTNIVLWVGAMWWAESSAPREPAGSWRNPLHFRGGVVAYLPHALERYLALGIWAHLLLMGILFLLLWRYCSTGRAVPVR